MSVQDDALAELSQVGALAGIRWAYLSAASQTFEDFSEATGHDATWLGNNRFILFRDRLDRVFACERYALPLGSDDDSVSLDLLHATLSEHDVETMPHLSPGLVVRANLNGSPGWAVGRWRWLLSSFVFDGIDEIPWPRKSKTKQRIAAQPNPDGIQTSLFAQLDDDEGELGGLEAFFAADRALDDYDTLVVAHGQDIVNDGRQLFLGRPKLNLGGGFAWHWFQDLLSAPPAVGGRRTDDRPQPTGPDTVPDAPVRLRPAAEQADGATRE